MEWRRAEKYKYYIAIELCLFNKWDTVRVAGFCSTKSVAELFFCQYLGDVEVTEGNGARGKFGKELIGDFVEDVDVLVIGFVVVVFVVGLVVVVSAAFYTYINIRMETDRKIKILQSSDYVCSTNTLRANYFTYDILDFYCLAIWNFRTNPHTIL